MLTVVIIIHLMLVIAMIGVVLLQKSEGGGLVGGGNAGGFLTSRGTANVLSRTTALLAAGFFLTSLALSWLAGYAHRPVSIINSSSPARQETPAGAPATPPGTAPLNPGSGGLLNQLQKGIPGLPSGENPNFRPQPSGPQVPESK